MRLPRLYAGFDGGGTRTVCVISDSVGQIIGRGSAGPSNFHNVGVGGALTAIRSSFAAATSRLGTEGNHRLEACLGIAGLDSPRDMRAMTGAIGSLRLSSDPLVVNDWRIALAGAFIQEPGVVLIAGTGCVAAGQDSAGRVVRVGGWGSVIDDRGSAYDVGREALHAAMRSYDGRGPKTQLLQMLMKRLKAKEPRGLVERVYSGKMGVAEIALLAVLVSQAASEGDRVSREILEDKAEILAELATTTAARLNLSKMAVRISLSGGVFKAGGFIRGPLETRIRSSAPLARIVPAALPPECGAVILLLRRAGLSVDHAVVVRMRSSLSRIG